MIGIRTLAGGPLAPYDEAALGDEAEEQCLSAFRDYVGVEQARSSLGLDFYGPSSDEWARGDRLVICVAVGPDTSPLAASVKESQE